MAAITTLVHDIYNMFGGGVGISEEALAEYGSSAAMAVQKQVATMRGPRTPNSLYMSEIGKPCQRQLWYGVKHPELGEPLQPHTQFKFLYGDLLEETVLLLAEASGHKVERRQEKVSVRVMHGAEAWRVAGRLDAVIDGVLVDVKSCSSYSYKKFKEGLSDANDAFGYRDQLSGYNYCFVETMAQGFLAIDKANGSIGWFPEPYQGAIELRLASAVAAAANRATPPRKFGLVPDGKSGNMKLGVECSYCPFKWICWHDANGGEGLKAYNYSYGPVFLGTVVRTPMVPELDIPFKDILDARIGGSSCKKS